METVGRTVTKIMHSIILYQTIFLYNGQMIKVKVPELGRSRQQTFAVKLRELIKQGHWTAARIICVFPIFHQKHVDLLTWL